MEYVVDSVVLIANTSLSAQCLCPLLCLAWLILKDPVFRSLCWIYIIAVCLRTVLYIAITFRFACWQGPSLIPQRHCYSIYANSTTMASSTDQVSSSSPFRLLGLGPKATQSDVRKAYLALSLRYHPDKSDGTTHEIFVAIKAAYEAAYEKCVRDADRWQSEQARGTGSTAPASYHFNSEPAPPPSAPPSASWPLHQRCTTPPEEFSSSPNDYHATEPLTYNEVYASTMNTWITLLKYKRLQLRSTGSFLRRNSSQNTQRPFEQQSMWVVGS